MVPHRGASKVNVEVGETALHAHQTVPAAQKWSGAENTSQPQITGGEQTLQSHLTRDALL